MALPAQSTRLKRRESAEIFRLDLPAATGDERHKVISPQYPLTPSPSLVPATEVSRWTDATPSSRTKDGAEHAHARVASLDSDRPIVLADDPVEGPPRTTHAGPIPNTRLERVPRENLVPFYAGEVGGHEFLFEVCSPNRSLRGSPYIISRNIHKRPRFKPETGSRPRFPSAVCQELLRCFFNYIYPILPVVHAGDFLTKYTHDPNSVSGLLLWSIFLSAASYLDTETLSSAGFKNRKQLKEFCFQHAKATYDAQVENDKTAVIASTLLLGFWYVDLEDQDGSGYWIGIAIHLCYTIGLHREPNYARLPRCPFPESQRALWRRLWWCAYYRDAWFCLGAGRPMRAHIDDCDLELPTVEYVTDDFKELSSELREAFLPSKMEKLADLWIKMLQLSIKLEYTTILHYRPRRPPLSVPQLEADHADVLRLLASLDPETEHKSSTLALHTSHFETYVNTVVIILHRPYVLSAPEHLQPSERTNLQTAAIQACKSAAAAITNTLSKLIADNMIETSPTTLVTPIMMAMQIHFYELARSEGLLRQHALHNLNLHFMVLTHLKKTFWTADMHHNLFTECIKALNSGKGDQSQYGGCANGLQDPTTAARPNSPRDARDDQAASMGSMLEASGLSESAFEEFFASFGPFDNLSSLFEDR
ncbi:hypothetical protein A1O7_07769 [Cladophialophora yegresii CBS 114405]|uniref:Xylanolytic transcriptional activator regulatory domain-containing protein n=1 Tax=Cladophialophora yegresii CBS 114405 TaxID=1182544 RepID=W9VYU2_9EURO|nr:uncharacterized protein A1O7_07769 [Cladophialophora yegresii CBS 114405]EXJ57421.1 hypothetical protein A1O7_07769 [Cladophialophora yegresii CBS 114405]